MRAYHFCQAALLLSDLQGTLAAAWPDPVSEDICPAPVLIQPVEVILNNLLPINTLVTANTVLVLDSILTLTITNAPIRISTVVTSVVTSLTTLTRTGAFPGVSAATTDYPDNLQSEVRTPTSPPPNPVDVATVLESPALDALTGPRITSAGHSGTGSITTAILLPQRSEAIAVASTPETVSGHTPAIAIAKFSGPYTTIIGGFGGSAAVTLTLPPSGSDPVGTVIIETPTSTASPFSGPYTTIIGGFGGSTAVTLTLPPSGSDPVGTVLIETPTSATSHFTGPYTTIIGGFGGPAAVTVTLPPSGSDPVGTVLIETPKYIASQFSGPYTTIIGGFDGSTAVTLTLPPSGSDPVGTVIIETPTTTASQFSGPYTTIIGGFGGSAAVTFTLPPSGSDPVGTVIIETPTATASQVTGFNTINTRDNDETASGSTAPSPSQSLTVGTPLILALVSSASQVAESITTILKGYNQSISLSLISASAGSGVAETLIIPTAFVGSQLSGSSRTNPGPFDGSAASTSTAPLSGTGTIGTVISETPEVGNFGSTTSTVSATGSGDLKSDKTSTSVLSGSLTSVSSFPLTSALRASQTTSSLLIGASIALDAASLASKGLGLLSSSNGTPSGAETTPTTSSGFGPFTSTPLEDVPLISSTLSLVIGNNVTAIIQTSSSISGSPSSGISLATSSISSGVLEMTTTSGSIPIATVESLTGQSNLFSTGMPSIPSSELSSRATNSLSSLASVTTSDTGINVSPVIEGIGQTSSQFPTVASQQTSIATENDSAAPSTTMRNTSSSQAADELPGSTLLPTSSPSASSASGRPSSTIVLSGSIETLLSFSSSVASSNLQGPAEASTVPSAALVDSPTGTSSSTSNSYPTTASQVSSGILSSDISISFFTAAASSPPSTSSSDQVFSTPTITSVSVDSSSATSTLSAGDILIQASFSESLSTGLLASVTDTTTTPSSSVNSTPSQGQSLQSSESQGLPTNATPLVAIASTSQEISTPTGVSSDITASSALDTSPGNGLSSPTSQTSSPTASSVASFLSASTLVEGNASGGTPSSISSNFIISTTQSSAPGLVSPEANPVSNGVLLGLTSTVVSTAPTILSTTHSDVATNIGSSQGSTIMSGTVSNTASDFYGSSATGSIPSASSPGLSSSVFTSASLSEASTSGTSLSPAPTAGTSITQAVQANEAVPTVFSSNSASSSGSFSYSSGAASIMSSGSPTSTASSAASSSSSFQFSLSNIANLPVASKTTFSSATNCFSTVVTTATHQACVSTLPQPCEALNTVNGLALLVDVPLCVTALGPFAVGNVGACLGTSSIGITSVGSTITTCLSQAFQATCISTLPSSCTALGSENGLVLLSDIPECITQLGPFAAGDALLCLSTANVNIFTTGQSIITCLTGALQLGPSASVTSVVSVACPIPSSVSPQGCQATLPPDCSNLSSENGLSLIADVPLCLGALGVYGIGNAAACLATNVITLGTTGTSIIDCLADALQAQCPTALPSACNDLSEFNGLELAAEIPLCITALGPYAAGNALACLATTAGSESTTGSSVVACLESALDIIT